MIDVRPDGSVYKVFLESSEDVESVIKVMAKTVKAYVDLVPENEEENCNELEKDEIENLPLTHYLA